jgi:hypothetical protein
VGKQADTLTAEVEQALDAVCVLGCDEVRACIADLQKGETRPEYARLDADQRIRMLSELQAIMSVYDDRC